MRNDKYKEDALNSTLGQQFCKTTVVDFEKFNALHRELLKEAGRTNGEAENFSKRFLTGRFRLSNQENLVEIVHRHGITRALQEKEDCHKFIQYLYPMKSFSQHQDAGISDIQLDPNEYRPILDRLKAEYGIEDLNDFAPTMASTGNGTLVVNFSPMAYFAKILMKDKNSMQYFILELTCMQLISGVDYNSKVVDHILQANTKPKRNIFSSKLHCLLSEIKIGVLKFSYTGIKRSHNYARLSRMLNSPLQFVAAAHSTQRQNNMKQSSTENVKQDIIKNSENLSDEFINFTAAIMANGMLSALTFMKIAKTQWATSTTKDEATADNIGYNSNDPKHFKACMDQAYEIESFVYDIIHAEQSKDKKPFTEAIKKAFDQIKQTSEGIKQCEYGVNENLFKDRGRNANQSSNEAYNEKENIYVNLRGDKSSKTGESDQKEQSSGNSDGHRGQNNRAGKSKEGHVYNIYCIAKNAFLGIIQQLKIIYASIKDKIFSTNTASRQSTGNEQAEDATKHNADFSSTAKDKSSSKDTQGDSSKKRNTSMDDISSGEQPRVGLKVQAQSTQHRRKSYPQRRASMDDISSGEQPRVELKVKSQSTKHIHRHLDLS